MSRILHVELTPTNNCNQNCSYCFERGCEKTTISTDEADRQLALLAATVSNLESDGYDGICLSFWGGEPFLLPRFMSSAIHDVVRAKKYMVSIYSNGTWTHGMDEFLSLVGNDIMSHVSIQFSYDGEPHHAAKRGYDPESMFEYCSKFKVAGAKVGFKATLAPDMIPNLPDIWKSYERLYDRFGDCVSYSPTLEVGRNIPESCMSDWKAALVKVSKMELDFVERHGRPLMSWFSGDVRKNCRMADTVHVQPDGGMFVCHGCPYKTDPGRMRLGSTADISKFGEVTFKENPGNLPRKCVGCDATYCAVCHAVMLNPEEDPIGNWLPAKTRDETRCNMFRTFGRIYMAFRLAYCRKFSNCQVVPN